MAKKNKPARKISSKKDLEATKENLEKLGGEVGGLVKDLFRGVGRILDVAREIEEKGEEVRTFKKEIKGFTESGKEFRGEAGWRVGFLDSLLKRKKKEDK